MSLSRKDKELLHQAILRITRVITDLDDTPVDPRVLDMLEICGSLLEQQIEMEIVFENYSATENNEVILFEQQDIEDENIEVVHIKFEEDSNIPSPEDLENWFNLGD